MFKLPELPFAYNALEPFMDAKTVEVHYARHHQTYVDNANKAMEGLSGFDGLCPGQVLQRLAEIPAERRPAVRNNVGGHVNHSLFWKCLGTGTELKGELKDAIIRDFGSVESFKKELLNTALTQFGSGWGWLIMDNQGKLFVAKTANQNSPIMGKEFAGVEGIPLLLIDVWEHAYYLKYQNKRADYLEALWNIINWDYVAQRFANRGDMHAHP